MRTPDRLWTELRICRDDAGDDVPSPVRFDGIEVDVSGHGVSRRGWERLYRVATAANVTDGVKRLFHGDQVNVTEGRPALHTALRFRADAATAAEAFDEAAAARDTMLDLADALRAGTLKGVTGKSLDTVVNIGIGGSDLGPRMVVDALDDHQGPVKTHFLANVDGHQLQRVWSRIDPETTLFCVVSKSFGTRETLLNASTLRALLADHVGVDETAAGAQFLAVTSNVDKAVEFGVEPSRILPMWDWVGGRYSLWSNVGFSIAAALGREAFIELLKGAELTDRHVLHSPPEENAAIQLALAGIWQRNVLDAPVYTVVSYDTRLALFGEFLQQLDMESNGKRVDLRGQPLTRPSGPAVFGGVGTLGQHAYFQWLHQGTDRMPVDLIAVVQPDHGHAEHHRELLANYVGQAWALEEGRDREATMEAMRDQGREEGLTPHCTFPGNRGTTLITLDRLTPRSLGSLIALYEHKVFVQGWIWGINSFDQWGVELGKTLAKRAEPWLAGNETPADLGPRLRRLLRRLLP